MQPTPLIQLLKEAGETPVAGAVRGPDRPRVRPRLARVLVAAAERLDPGTPVRAVGPRRHGAGP